VGAETLQNTRRVARRVFNCNNFVISVAEVCALVRAIPVLVFPKLLRVKHLEIDDN